LGYIVDFYNRPNKLAIELDGQVHDKPDVINNDRARERYLKENGITVIHFKNHSIFDNPKKVLKSILYYIEQDHRNN
jgi:imidazole glycerol-phosphate synthase subunit HisF